eukprot:g73463.t1
MVEHIRKLHVCYLSVLHHTALVCHANTVKLALQGPRTQISLGATATSSGRVSTPHNNGRVEEKRKSLDEMMNFSSRQSFSSSSHPDLARLASISYRSLGGIRFILTGFGEFNGVKHNPTEQLMKTLPEYLKTTKNVIRAPKFKKMTAIGTRRTVWVHFGVDSGATGYKLECRAFNEADFRVPDQRGWQPKKEKIDELAPKVYYTTLPLPEICAQLRDEGFPVDISYDAGRFVCNWIYFLSLEYTKIGQNGVALFVHVPPFSNDCTPKQQLQFTTRLLEVLSIRCQTPFTCGIWGPNTQS